MTPIRVGAVGYLNAKPLVYGLERHPRFTIRYDAPARCASLLHEGAIDLGLIPSIEYLHHADYRIVPDVGVVSHGAVSSVALFSSRPLASIRTIALDSSSRTSVALLRILCARWFDIAPEFVTCAPDLAAMMANADASLLIGDRALFADHGRLGLEKIDLGEHWSQMTGLPFVYACWVGRTGAVFAGDVSVLESARDQGAASVAAIARRSFPEDETRIQRAEDYLRHNVQYVLGEAECEGLRTFFEYAGELKLVPSVARLQFFPREAHSA